MSRTATQLAGNASSIFQAWLDLKQQTGRDTRTNVNRTTTSSESSQRQRNTPR